eukprot:1136317-Pelagomonas_calceolata.AAC.2
MMRSFITGDGCNIEGAVIMGCSFYERERPMSPAFVYQKLSEKEPCLLVNYSCVLSSRCLRLSRVPSSWVPF